MLASGSFSSVQAADLPASGDHQEADPALVSFVVLFSYVRNRSACPTEDWQPRSQTVANYAVPSRADLESVWAATVTPRPGSGRSAGISDGNRDGNGDSRQHPETAVDNHVPSQNLT
jgi:hypothetical protein